MIPAMVLWNSMGIDLKMLGCDNALFDIDEYGVRQYAVAKCVYRSID